MALPAKYEMQSLDNELEKNKDLIRNTFFKGSTNEEMTLFIEVCKATKLNPILRQIHAVKRKCKSGDTVTFQTGIDGFRLIAERTGNYAPGKEPSYSYNKEGGILSATAYVKKRTSDGTWHEVAATAFWSEYAIYVKDYESGQRRLNDFWKDKSHIMLAKCAEALALRKAFPADLSGIYADDEMPPTNGSLEMEKQAQETIDSSFEVELPEIPLEAPKEVYATKFQKMPSHQENKTEKMISDAQLYKIRKLVDTVDPDYYKAIFSLYQVSRYEDLTSKQASTCIQNLLAKEQEKKSRIA